MYLTMTFFDRPLFPVLPRQGSIVLPLLMLQRQAAGCYILECGMVGSLGKQLSNFEKPLTLYFIPADQLMAVDYPILFM